MFCIWMYVCICPIFYCGKHEYMIVSITSKADKLLQPSLPRFQDISSKGGMPYHLYLSRMWGPSTFHLNPSQAPTH